MKIKTVIFSFLALASLHVILWLTIEPYRYGRRIPVPKEVIDVFAQVGHEHSLEGIPDARARAILVVGLAVSALVSTVPALFGRLISVHRREKKSES